MYVDIISSAFGINSISFGHNSSTLSNPRSAQEEYINLLDSFLQGWINNLVTIPLLIICILSFNNGYSVKNSVKDYQIGEFKRLDFKDNPDTWELRADINRPWISVG